MRDTKAERLLTDVRKAVAAARAGGVSVRACVFDAVVAAVNEKTDGWPTAEARHIADEACRAVESPTDQQDQEDQEEPPGRAFHELQESGLLWLINHRILHRRGLALALHLDGDDGMATGWSLLRSPDGQPWTFPTEINERGRERAEATLTAAGALPTRQTPELPPFTGDSAECPKCSYDLIRTTYCHPLRSGTRDTLNGVWAWGPLQERHRRECERCEYQWYEAIGREPLLPVPLTARQLAYALDNSTPYPEEIPPDLASVMAARLTEMFTAYPRPGHVVWDPDVQDARPEAIRPTPEDAPSTEAPATEEVAGE
jgi:hypothetical protein